MDKLNYTLPEDTQAEFLDSHDEVSKRTLKVYPYEMLNLEEDIALIQENTVSIAAISQYKLQNKEQFHTLLVDKDTGDYYFEIFAAITENAVLDITQATSVFGTSLENQLTIQAVTNQYMSKDDFKPMMATIGKPFDRAKYENDEQQVYLITTIKSATDMTKVDLANNPNVIPDVSLNEIELNNVKLLERKYNKARLLFSSNINLAQNITIPSGGAGVTLGIETHMLVHSIKAKGTTVEFDNKGNQVGQEFGEIDLISKEKWAPFKGTPTSIKDKLVMFWDWFDYDTVLPFVFAEKFKAGASLSTVITDPFDLKMIEDMLTVSAGYASSWDTAPVILTGTDTGKIQPTFRVGHSGIKVSVIAGKDPIKVVDGIYENHIRRHPEFETNVERYQKAKGVINALSRYIYSSYAIGKGQNSFNQAYLPWYLEPYFSTPIKFDKKMEVDNLDKGFAGQKVDSFVLDDGIKFIAKSLYFHEKFSDDLAIKGTSDLLLPKKINMSSQKLVQTDRKLTLPELPDNVAPINKLPLPGDINTKSSNDLKYLFYVPIQDQTVFEEFMLNTLTPHTSVVPGTDLTVQLPRGIDGKVYTQQEANEAVLQVQKGTLKTAPIISAVETQKGAMVTGSWGSSNDFGRGYLNTNDEYRFEIYGETKIKTNLARRYGYKDIDSIVLHFTSFAPGQDINQDGRPPEAARSTFGSFSVTHSEFTPAIVTTTSQTTQTYSFQGRQVLFDKQEWKDFLVKFNIVPDGFTRYSFEERANWVITKMDELIISSLWGNEIEIFFGSGPNDYFKIPLFNKDDETIATQRILFV